MRAIPTVPLGALALICLASGVAARGGPDGTDPLTPASIARAAAYSRQTTGLSLLIARGNTILHEEYSGGARREDRFHVRSITKSLTALAAMEAEHSGGLDLEKPIGKQLPGQKFADITPASLLDMTSGLDGAAAAIYRQPIASIPNVAMAAPRLNPPGTAFQYGPSNYELLGELLRRHLEPQRQLPEQFLLHRVLRPARIAPPDFRRDARGNPYYSAGASMRGIDLLHLGGLVRARADAIRSGANGGPNPMYHRSFWLNVNAGHPDVLESEIEPLLGRPPGSVDWHRIAISRSAPADLIALIGSKGQRVYVIPSLDLVVARQGESAAFRDAEFLNRLVGVR